MNKRVLRQNQDIQKEGGFGSVKKIVNSTPLYSLTEGEQVEIEDAILEDEELPKEDDMEADFDEYEMDLGMEEDET